jgi:hypothetical protein
MTTDGPPPVSPSRPVAFDLPCAQCGYNLRGLSPAGCCPECGLRISDSAYADAFVGPLPWVRTVARGVERLCAIMALYPPLILAVILLFSVRHVVGLLVAWGLWLVLQFWHVRAVWQIATLQPSDGPRRISRRGRALALAELCAALLLVAPLTWLTPRMFPMDLWGAALLLTAGTEAYAVMELGCSLAERLGTYRITWRGRGAGIFYASSLVLLSGLLIMPRLTHAVNVRVILAVALCGALAGALWRLIELGRLRTALQRFYRRADYGVLRG